mmetsp:Transcript_45485/g.103033  ORF Transcript_45485/g.103033 Transcript_45485/m.103033 type:complete len:1179 (+) Transcript_45485:47-3583(+)
MGKKAKAQAVDLRSMFAGAPAPSAGASSWSGGKPGGAVVAAAKPKAKTAAKAKGFGLDEPKKGLLFEGPVPDFDPAPRKVTDYRKMEGLDCLCAYADVDDRCAEDQPKKDRILGGFEYMLNKCRTGKIGGALDPWLHLIRQARKVIQSEPPEIATILHPVVEEFFTAQQTGGRTSERQLELNGLVDAYLMGAIGVKLGADKAASVCMRLARRMSKGAAAPSVHEACGVVFRELVPLVQSMETPNTPTVLDILVMGCFTLDTEDGRIGCSACVGAIAAVLGIATLKKTGVLQTITDAVSDSAKDAAKKRHGALACIGNIAAFLQKLFEPYFMPMVPKLLDACSDTNKMVAEMGVRAGKQAIANLTDFGIKTMVPKLLTAAKVSMKAHNACLDLLGAVLTNLKVRESKHTSSLLPKIIPVIIESARDIKVAKMAQERLEQISDMVSHPEVKAVSGKLVAGLAGDEAKAKAVVDDLLNTAFVHKLDPAAASLVLALSGQVMAQRGEVRRKGAALIAGVAKIAADAELMAVQAQTVLPELRRMAVEAQPDIRRAAADALGALGDAAQSEIVGFRELLASDSPAERSGAAAALGAIISNLTAEGAFQAAVEDLVVAVGRDEEDESLEGSIMLLGVLGSLPSFDPFLQRVMPVVVVYLGHLKVGEASLATCTVLSRGLVKKAPAFVYNTLEAVVMCPDPKARRSLVDLLVDLDSDDSKALLLILTFDPDRDVSRVAARQMQNFGRPTDPMIQRAAVRTCAAHPNTATVKFCVKYASVVLPLLVNRLQNNPERMQTWGLLAMLLPEATRDCRPHKEEFIKAMGVVLQGRSTLGAEIGKFFSSFSALGDESELLDPVVGSLGAERVGALALVAPHAVQHGIASGDSKTLAALAQADSKSLGKDAESLMQALVNLQSSEEVGEIVAPLDLQIVKQVLSKLPPSGDGVSRVLTEACSRPDAKELVPEMLPLLLYQEDDVAARGLQTLVKSCPDAVLDQLDVYAELSNPLLKRPDCLTTLLPVFLTGVTSGVSREVACYSLASACELAEVDKGIAMKMAGAAVRQIKDEGDPKLRLALLHVLRAGLVAGAKAMAASAQPAIVRCLSDEDEAVREQAALICEPLAALSSKPSVLLNAACDIDNALPAVIKTLKGMTVAPTPEVLERAKEVVDGAPAKYSAQAKEAISRWL